MKKISGFIIIAVVLLSSAVLLFLFDSQQQSDYRLFFADEVHNYVTITRYAERGFDEADVQYLLDTAIEHEINISFSTYDEESKISTFYITEPMRNEVCKGLEVDNCDAEVYSTFGNDANIKDVMENDLVQYLSYEDALKNKDIIYEGSFDTGAQSYEQLDQYMTKVAEHFDLIFNPGWIGSDIDYGFRINFKSNNHVKIPSLFVILVLFIALIMTIIQKNSNNTKHIGVFSLLGYSNTKIIKKLFASDFIAIVSCNVLFLITLLTISNASITLYVQIIIKDLILLLIVFSIYGFILNKTKKNSVGSIIKKVNISGSLNKFVLAIQIILSIGIMIFALIYTTIVSDFIDLNKAQSISNYANNYGTIGYVDNDYSDQNNFDLIENLLYYINENEILSEQMIYTNVHNMEALSYSLYSSVDSNYLKAENVKVFDDSGKIVEIARYNTEDIFVFPKNYEGQQKDVLDKYFDDNDELYNEDKSLFNPIILYYDNTELRTYDLNAITSDSPVLKILNSSDKRTYMMDYNGISAMGMGTVTALKFNCEIGVDIIKNELEKVFAQIDPNNEIGFNFDRHFIIMEEQQKENYYFKMLELKFGLGFIVVLYFLYIFIKLQFISLYTTENNREISIKKHLGYSYNLIYKEIYKLELIIYCISLFIAIGIKIACNLKADMIIFMVGIVLVLVTDLLLTYLITIIHNKLKTAKNIKGGY